MIDSGVTQSSGRTESQEHRHHHAPVTNTVGNKSFLSSSCCAFAGVPERDQEVRASTHAFPTEEGDEQVFAHDQHQHREHEQVEIQEELGELRIAVHVANGVQVNERSNSGHKQCHRDAERIGQEGQVNMQRTDRDPRERCEHMMAFFHRF